MVVLVNYNGVLDSKLCDKKYPVQMNGPGRNLSFGWITINPWYISSLYATDQTSESKKWTLIIKTKELEGDLHVY